MLFTKFLDIPKTVIIMQWKGMTVFVKISESISQALSLFSNIPPQIHSSLLGSNFVANWWYLGLEYPAHVMIVIDVGFLKVLFIYLFLCFSFWFFLIHFLCIGIKLCSLENFFFTLRDYRWTQWQLSAKIYGTDIKL